MAFLSKWSVRVRVGWKSLGFGGISFRTVIFCREIVILAFLFHVTVALVMMVQREIACGKVLHNDQRVMQRRPDSSFTHGYQMYSFQANLHMVASARRLMV